MTSAEEFHWPPLPANCPTAGAAPRSGTFYRLVRGNEAGWQTHAMFLGPDKYPAKVGACRWNALSVFSSVEGARRYRRDFKSLRGCTIVSFQVDAAMGVLLQDKPPETHHDWWPSDAFQPPPDCEIVKDDVSG